MSVVLRVRNETAYTRLYRRDALKALAETVCAGEGIEGDVEVSVLLCDDETISGLNEKYRATHGPTDVLSFGQAPVELHGAPQFLGDIVISLETVDRACKGDRSDMRNEVRLLFCHGLLHLLGYDHQTTDERDRMAAKQADYLGVPMDDAWHWVDKAHPK